MDDLSCHVSIFSTWYYRCTYHKGSPIGMSVAYLGPCDNPCSADQEKQPTAPSATALMALSRPCLDSSWVCWVCRDCLGRGDQRGPPKAPPWTHRSSYCILWGPGLNSSNPGCVRPLCPPLSASRVTYSWVAFAPS